MNYFLTKNDMIDETKLPDEDGTQAPPEVAPEEVPAE